MTNERVKQIVNLFGNYEWIERYIAYFKDENLKFSINNICR